jgi:hypothetical protein
LKYFKGTKVLFNIIPPWFVLLQWHINTFSPLSGNFMASSDVVLAKKAQANPGRFAPTNIIKSKTPNIQLLKRTRQNPMEVTECFFKHKLTGDAWHITSSNLHSLSGRQLTKKIKEKDTSKPVLAFGLF